MTVLRYKIKWEKHVTEETPARRWNLSSPEQENVKRAIRALRLRHGAKKLAELLSILNSLRHGVRPS